MRHWINAVHTSGEYGDRLCMPSLDSFGSRFGSILVLMCAPDIHCSARMHTKPCFTCATFGPIAEQCIAFISTTIVRRKRNLFRRCSLVVFRCENNHVIWYIHDVVCIYAFALSQLLTVDGVESRCYRRRHHKNEDLLSKTTYYNAWLRNVRRQTARHATTSARVTRVGERRWNKQRIHWILMTTIEQFMHRAIYRFVCRFFSTENSWNRSSNQLLVVWCSRFAATPRAAASQNERKKDKN